MLKALILTAALALPFAADAQAPATPAPPITAPTKDAGKVPPEPQSTVEAAKVATPPSGAPSATMVPGWNNPPSWAAASERAQYASVPGTDTNRLIQVEGREWRAFRNGPLTRYAGWIIAAVAAVLVLFYLIKGQIKLHEPRTGRLIERFNAVERVAHWTVAISFIFLALSGVVILWGKHIVLPWLGYEGFSLLTIACKNLHNFVGPLFIFSLLVMFLIYVKDNIIHARDIKWLAKLGGMLGGKEVPSGRFNGGEKMWFWGGLVLLGVIVSVTGLILDFPNWNQGRELMQQANVIHAIAAVLFISGALGHSYLGTIGMEGAYRGMRDGFVDETWAKQHHELWYEEVKAGKRDEKVIGAVPQPAAGDD